MGYQPTRSNPDAKPPSKTNARRNLIRCDYCGMNYDGTEHDNCPHCLAPRSGENGLSKATKAPSAMPCSTQADSPRGVRDDEKEVSAPSVTLETVDDWIHELSDPSSEMRNSLVTMIALLGVTAFLLVALLAAYVTLSH